jgi:hypothetical protein
LVRSSEKDCWTQLSSENLSIFIQRDSDPVNYSQPWNHLKSVRPNSSEVLSHQKVIDVKFMKGSQLASWLYLWKHQTNGIQIPTTRLSR